jgi:hypothetical protein
MVSIDAHPLKAKQVPLHLSRARSKDVLTPLNNEFVSGGAQRIVENSRIDSQRNLLNRYKQELGNKPNMGRLSPTNEQFSLVGQHLSRQPDEYQMNSRNLPEIRVPSGSR